MNSGVCATCSDLEMLTSEPGAASYGSKHCGCVRSCSSSSNGSSRRSSIERVENSENSEDEWMPFKRSTPDLRHSDNWTNDGFISPFQRTSLEKLARLVPYLRLTPSDVVFDLGCGDGRVLIECVQRSGCRGRGIELDDKLLEKAWRSARRRGVEDKVVFEKADVTSHNVDLSSATIVFLYLLPEALGLIRSTLEGHLKQASCRIRAIVSLRWPVPGFPPIPENADGFYIYDAATLKKALTE